MGEEGKAERKMISECCEEFQGSSTASTSSTPSTSGVSHLMMF